MNALQLIFGILFGISAVYTVWGFPRKYGALSGRSRLFRTIGMVLINLLLVTLVIFFSTDWNGQLYQVGVDPARARYMVKISQLLYFVTWLLMGVFLMGVALFDSLENFTLYRRQRREALEKMIADAVAVQQQKRAVTTANNENGKDSTTA